MSNVLGEFKRKGIALKFGLNSKKMMTYILVIDEEPSKHHGNIEFVAG